MIDVIQSLKVQSPIGYRSLGKDLNTHTHKRPEQGSIQIESQLVALFWGEIQNFAVAENMKLIENSGFPGTLVPWSTL